MQLRHGAVSRLSRWLRLGYHQYGSTIRRLTMKPQVKRMRVDQAEGEADQYQSAPLSAYDGYRGLGQSVQ